MTLGLSATEASGLLSAQFQSTAYSADGSWMQLHTDEPGADGTANICALSTRADGSAAFGTAPATGTGVVTITNDAVIGATEWADPPATETPTHVSRWSDPTGGTFLGSGVLSAGSITAHSPYQLDIGTVSAGYNIAS